MRVSVRKRAPVMGRAILLVVAAVKISAPAPFFRPSDQCARVVVPYPGGESENAVSHFKHGGARRMNIAVGCLPKARVVVQKVITRAAVRVCSPSGNQMLHPVL